MRFWSETIDRGSIISRALDFLFVVVFLVEEPH